MTDEQIYRCDGCGGAGNGLQVGEDSITGRRYCPRCYEKATLDRVLGADWGEKTVMRTDPNVTKPLPAPTIEEALGADVLAKHPELSEKKLEEVGNVNKRIDDLEGKMDKILELLGGKDDSINRHA